MANERGRLARLAFAPESLDPGVVVAIALVPPAAAAVILFRAPAALMLGTGAVVGLAAHLGARLLRQPLQASPALSAVIAAGLVGPGAALPWAAGAAAAAALLELARGRLQPALPAHTGLLAYAGFVVASRGGPAGWVAPGGRPFPEPVALWQTFFPAGAAPIDPVRLYVGNVAGPALATSLLAVTVGLAWLWYARRLEPLVIAGAAVAAGAFAASERWDLAYQVVSGPLWFAVGYTIADRRLLPGGPRALSLAVGAAAGLAALAIRARGYGIEASLVAVAAVQAGAAVIVVVSTLVRSGRLGIPGLRPAGAGPQSK